MKSAAKLSVLVCTALLIVFSSTSAVCAADVITEEPDAETAAEAITEDVPEPAETAEEAQEEIAETPEISASGEEILPDEESVESDTKEPEIATEDAEKASEVPVKESAKEPSQDTAKGSDKSELLCNEASDDSLLMTVYQRVKGGNGYADVSDLNISGEQSDQLFSFLCSYADSISLAKDDNGNVTYVFFNSFGEDNAADTESLYQEIYKRLLDGKGYADISDMDISEDQEDALSGYLSSYSDSVTIITDNGHILYVMFDDEEEGGEAPDTENADAETVSKVSGKKAVISERSEVAPVEPEEFSGSDADDEAEAVEIEASEVPLDSEQSPEEPVGALMGIALFVVAGIRHLIECL